MEMVKKLRR